LSLENTFLHGPLLDHPPRSGEWWEREKTLFVETFSDKGNEASLGPIRVQTGEKIWTFEETEHGRGSLTGLCRFKKRTQCG
jgi:hypothetical protein